MNTMTTHPLSDPTVRQARTVEAVVDGVPTSDGAGVKLSRVLTHHWQRRLDPYLMLDAFHTDDADDYIGGFPAHPHRGFETVTYMLAGRMRHRDSTGGEGLLGQGGVQWMTAGAGIVHSEMPEQQEGLMQGFQLWLNLPAKDKLVPAGYRDIAPDEIPAFATAGGAQVKLVAGHSHGVDGAMQRPVTEPYYADVRLAAGGRFAEAIPAGHNAFVYVYEGAVTIAGQAVTAGRMAVLANDADADGVVVEAGGGARFLLITGAPLKEPIAQYGPFVMNTREQIEQALVDFQRGRMGELA
ncbi:MAG TPA: pirin family protein [Nevskiaceae bacterium]|nr:pirin family protein [Nevskiaceae bacterium]